MHEFWHQPIHPPPFISGLCAEEFTVAAPHNATAAWHESVADKSVLEDAGPYETRWSLFGSRQGGRYPEPQLWRRPSYQERNLYPRCFSRYRGNRACILHAVAIIRAQAPRADELDSRRSEETRSAAGVVGIDPTVSSTNEKSWKATAGYFIGIYSESYPPTSREPSL